MVHAWKIRPLFVYCCTLSLLACSENPARPVVKDAVGPATDSLVPGDIALLDSATVDLPTQEADQAAGKLDLSPTQPDMDPPNPGGPLAGLPSAPGGHITQLEALGDNEWLELQQPGADPK